MKVLEVKNLLVKNIFKSVSFTLQKSEILCIIGPNGAGKTTLLKALIDLIPNYSGSIVKKKGAVFSYIPQHLGLIKNKTVYYNLLLGYLPKMNFWQSILHRFPDKAYQRADFLINFFKLEPFKNYKVCNISGGEKRRLAIARALMLEPDVLLADEIFSNLDFVKSKMIIKKLKKLQQEGLSIIIIEHDLCIAREFSNKISLLHNGVLKENVDPKEFNDLKLCKLFN